MNQRIKMALRGIFLVCIMAITSQVYSQTTCVQSATASGLDTDPTTVTINPVNCQGAGVVSGVTMDATIGNACMFGWYYYNLKVNGITVATYLCDVSGYDLSSYMPITSVTLESADQNFIPNNITLTLSLNVTYNANVCSGTPSAGNAVADEFVACATDSFEVNLTNQSTGLGLSYQWQTSTDNVNWTDLTNDTLLTLRTAIAADAYFRCAVTCVGSGITSYSTSDFVAYGYCTPYTPLICNMQFNAGVEQIQITGFPGIATSPVVLSFDYSGSFGWSGSYLTVTDYIGNTLGQLFGSSVICDTVIDSLVIPAATFNTLLAAGNGVVDLNITPSNGVFANCPSPNGNTAYCISASAKAVPFLYQNDVGARHLVSPLVGNCVLDSTVSFELQNVGALNLTTADVNWSVNGIAQPSLAWTGNLNSLDLDTVSFGVYAGGFSDFDELKIWVSNPNGMIDSNAINDTLYQVLHPGLNGTYVIDLNGGGDFTGFNEAIQAAYQFGVCGPVTFEVADGTYIEQVELETSMINGVSASNTISFTSQSMDSSLVELVYSSQTNTSNFTLMLHNSAHVSFSHLSFKAIGTNYSRVLWTQNEAYNNHIRFTHCLFEGPTTSGSSQHNTLAYLYSDSNNYWHFENNTFLGGTHAIRMGKSGTGNDRGNVFIGNHITGMDASGIYVSYQDSLTIHDNYISTTATGNTSRFGIYVYNTNEEAIISNNHIEGGTDWPSYGIYLFNLTGTANSHVQVVNNRVYAPHFVTSSGLSLSSGEYVDIHHNSIYSKGQQAYNTAMRFSNGNNLDVQNNILQLHTATGGEVLWCTSESIFSTLDYNVYSVDVGDIVGIDTITYATLSAWQAASLLNDSSLVVDSVFTVVNDLKVCNDSVYQKGVSIAGMTHDFEGDPRMMRPCIGADEFMTINEVMDTHDAYELCDGDTLTLSQYYFETVTWNGVAGNELQVTTPGSQALFVNGVCGTTAIPVVVNSQQYVAISDANNCENDSVVITPSITNGTFVWSDGSTDSLFVADSAQMVTVMFTSTLGGCTSYDSAMVTQSSNVSLAYDSAQFCEGGSFTLTGDIAGSYLWSTGETSAFISVDSTSWYSVTVTEQNCVSEDSTYVSEILMPVVSFVDSIDGYDVYFTNTSSNGDTYFWEFGDGATSTLEHPMHTYASSAPLNYNVTLTATNICGDDQWSKYVTDTPDGITAVSWESHVAIFPNPVNQHINVSIENVSFTTGSLTLMNSVGTEIRVLPITNTNAVHMRVPTSALASGVYYLKITLDEEFTVKKFFKL